MILLGCVSPFAIRLRIERLGKSGRTAGQLYAISTAGSILGTFLPVLFLIPTIGTYRTLFTIAVTLLLVSIVGLASTRFDKPGSRRRRINSSLLPILLLIPMALSVLTIQGPIKAAFGSNGGGVLITERESVYNYIQVVKVGDETQLILNEGVGIHSIYNPNSILTQGPWDYFMIAPYFNNPPFTQNQVRKVAIIGLGGGTAVGEFTAAYGPIPIDGVEIDSTIVNMGRQYCHMNEPNLHVVLQDGRYYLQTSSQKFDVVAIDAYQQPYVPFQLTTKEFFQEVRNHLTPTGVTVINAGRTSSDFRLVNALAQTMHSVFPNVYIIDTARFTNSMVIGTNSPTSLNNFMINTGNLTNPLLQSVARESILYGNIREEHSRAVYFTDDRAPVEQLIDQIILGAVENKGN
jgi:predicted membrane-bound spermidine synthase